AAATPAGLVARRVGAQTWAEALLNPEVLASVRRGVDGPRAQLARIIRAAQAAGRLSPQLEPGALARAMVALFHGFVLQKLWDPSMPVEPYLEVLDALLDGVAATPGNARQASRRQRPTQSPSRAA